MESRGLATFLVRQERCLSPCLAWPVSRRLWPGNPRTTRPPACEIGYSMVISRRPCRPGAASAFASVFPWPAGRPGVIRGGLARGLGRSWDPSRTRDARPNLKRDTPCNKETNPPGSDDDGHTAMPAYTDPPETTARAAEQASGPRFSMISRATSRGPRQTSPGSASLPRDSRYPGTTSRAANPTTTQTLAPPSPATTPATGAAGASGSPSRDRPNHPPRHEPLEGRAEHPSHDPPSSSNALSRDAPTPTICAHYLFPLTRITLQVKLRKRKLLPPWGLEFLGNFPGRSFAERGRVHSALGPR